MVARTENQPDPPPLTCPPAAFEQLLTALGVEWRLVRSLRYDRQTGLLEVERVRQNEMGFPAEDRLGDPLTETFRLVVA